METYGIQEFERKLMLLAAEKFPKESKQFIRKMARRVASAARKHTPKGDTGNLRKGWKVGKIYIRKTGVWAVVKNTAPHVHLVELGHNITRKKGGPVYGRVAPNKFFKRAVEVNVGEFNAEFLAFLDKMLKEYRL